MPVVEFLQGIQATIETLKAARAIADKFDDASLKLVLADSMSQMADLKLAAVDLKEEVARLKEELNDIKRVKAESGNMALEGDMYFFTDSDGKKSGPYCMPCWENKGKRLSLKPEQSDFRIFGTHHCLTCNGHFGPPSRGGGRGLGGY
jgi:hypothetical protein